METVLESVTLKNGIILEPSNSIIGKQPIVIIRVNDFAIGIINGRLERVGKFYHIYNNTLGEDLAVAVFGD